MWLSRKGQTRLTLNTIIYTIIALIGIILLLVLVSRIIGLTSSTQGSMASFKTLALGIDTLVENPNATVCHISFGLEDNEALVGFNKGQSIIERGGLIINTKINRPDKCHMLKSCLLLCDVGSYVGKEDCSGGSLIDLKDYEGVGSFDYISQSGDTSPLVYYGSDGGVEFLSIEKTGELGDYGIRIYNRPEKLTRDAKPCEAFMTEENLAKIKAFQGAITRNN